MRAEETMHLWKGNHAIAEAALRAGAKLFAGYPITPSTEILEHLSSRMREEGRAFIQAESEIAAINIVCGAYAAGNRAFTATSGVGYSLMQETLAYASDAHLPSVVVNVMRGGRGMGSLESSQDGYRQAVFGGGNGDYRQIVFSPNSIQEAVDDTYEAFDIAEKYRIGVVIMTEASLGQMMEGIEMPPFRQNIQKPEWAIDGVKTYDLGFNRQTMDEKRESWTKKIEQIEREMQRYETIGLEDAEYVFVACGLPSRTTEDAVKKLRAAGEKVGLLRPKVLYPFPSKAYQMIPRNVKGVITVESTDFGMMVRDVALEVHSAFPERHVPIYLYAHGVGIPTTKEILDHYGKIRSGLEKEAF